MQARAAASVRSPCLPGACTATLVAGRLSPLRAGQQQRRHVQRSRRFAVQLPRAAARPSTGGGGGGGSTSREAPPLPAKAPGSGWRTFWAAVDTSAWLGTVGSAAAFLITQEAMLAAAPVVLPLLALYASRQRERLATAADQQAQLARLEGLLLEMQADAADEVAAEVGAEVAELLQLAQQAQQRSGGDPAKLMRAVEAKLSAMEGSVLSTGTTTRDALQQSAERQGQLSDRVMARLQDLGTALRRDVNGALQAAGGEDAAALSRLESRLQSLEGAIWGLQESQSEGMRRLNSGLAATLSDAELALQAAVREEAQRSLDPLRRLPELVQQAIPVTPDLVLGPDRALPAVSEEGLRLMVGEQLAAAGRQLLEQQAALLEELRAQPQTIAPQQWNQLGGRLADLQDQLEQLGAGASAAAAGGAAGSSSSGGGGGAGAEVAAVAAELTGLRSELGSLASAVQQLLEAQQQPAASSRWAAAGSSGGGSSMPPGMLAGVAAAVQAVQDQVVLLRQELDAEDPKQAAFVALEERLKLALAAMFEALAAEPLAGRGGGGGGGAAAAAAAAVDGGSLAPPAVDAAPTAALEQQQASLAAALDTLAGLGGRLDGMSEQLAALQGSVVAAPAAAAAAAAASPAIEQAAAALPAAAAASPAGAPPLEPFGPAAAAGVPGAAGDAREAAYRRMQDLLQQQSPQRLGGAARGSGDGAAGGNSGKAFAEWLAGPRDNIEEVDTATVSSASLTAAVAAAGPSGSAGPAADIPSSASSNGGGSMGGGLQQQIEFEAAMGALPAAQPGEAAAAAAEGLPPAAAAVGVGDAGSQPAAQEEGQGRQQQQQQQAPPQQEPSSAQQQPQEEELAAGAAVRAGPAPLEEQQAQQGQRRQLYERGVQRLREGRALAATPGADLGLADAAFWEASEAFEQLLAQAPRDLKALGNYGNTLLAHGKLKRRMVEAVEAAAAPADQQQAAAVAAARQRLAAEAQELLLLAGRKYRAVLELDPGQAKAFINWGRVVGLRAEMARDAGEAAEGARLFSLAADKLDNALDLEPQNGQAMRLAGQSLLDAGLCTLGTLGGGGGDGGAEAREARALIKDAAPYFESALALDPQDPEAAAGLEACRQQLAALKEQRREAGQQQQQHL